MRDLLTLRFWVWFLILYWFSPGIVFVLGGGTGW